MAVAVPMAVYTYQKQIAASTAITLIQLRTATTKPAVILRAWCSQQGLETSDQVGVLIVRKTAGATVTAAAAGDFRKHGAGFADPTFQFSTTATGHTATGEGTDDTAANAIIVPSDGWNILNGWLYLPVPEERVVIPVDTIVGLKLRQAPAASTTFNVGWTIAEIS